MADKIRSLVELPCEETVHFVASHWRMGDPRGVDALASPLACCTRVTSHDIPHMDSLLAGEG